MQVKIIGTDNKIVQIYINKTEKEEDSVQNRIQEIKGKYKDVSIFVSGNEDLEKRLKSIITFQKSLQD